MNALEKAEVHPRRSSSSSTARRSRPTRSSSAAARRPGMVTTKGFRDVLAAGRANRPDLFNSNWDPSPAARPAPAHPRGARARRLRGHRARGARTRTTSARRRASSSCAGSSRVAVAYINSFMRPDHERRTKEILLEELGDGAFVCTSSEILPEIREFERTSTVAANAYLMPVIESYIDSLVERPARLGLRGRGLRHPLRRRRRHRTRRAQRARAHLPLGPGRRRRRRAARRQARRLRERDHLRHGRHERRPRARPRRQADARARVAGRLEHPDPLPRDRPGRDRRRRRHDRVGRHRRLAARRAAERRRRSRPGLLRQGQRASRRSPTPTCTWAASNPETYLGGDLEIRPELAEQAIESLAEQLGLSAPETASGILRIANANMTSATHLISVERGYDPRDFALVAGGGAGPAARGRDRARAAASRRSSCRPPRASRRRSGILQVDLRHDLLAPVLQQVKGLDAEAARGDVRQAERRGHRDPRGRGHPRRPALDRALGRRPLLRADALHEPEARRASRDREATRRARRPVPRALRGRVRLPAARGRRDGRDRQRARRRDRHDRRRRAASASDGARRRRRPRSRGRAPSTSTRPATSPTRRSTTARCSAPARRSTGPAVIEQTDTTVLVPPGRHAPAVDKYLNIVIDVERQRPTARGEGSPPPSAKGG